MTDRMLPMTLDEFYEAVAVEDLNEDSTMHQLKSTVNVFFDTGRQSRAKRVQVPNMELVPSLNDNTLIAKADTATENGKYETVVLVDKVQYVQPNARHAINFTGIDGAEYWILPLKSNRNYVKVRCSCLDFYYRFAIWNHKNGSLLGDPPPPYVRKPGSNRAPVNPDKVDGVCKHIMGLADRMRADNIMK